jgi:hypothetical protein
MFKRYALPLAALLLLGQVSWAHHGWGWATDEEFEVSGRIVEVRLGYPHGEVDIQVGEERWVVEVGQPYRNTDAGLEWITVHGHRSARAGERLVKAERVVIGGESYNLYPDRES